MSRQMGDQQALALALEGKTIARGEAAELVALAEGLAALPEPTIDEGWAAALEARLLTEGAEPVPAGRPHLVAVAEPRDAEPTVEPVRRAPVVTLPRRRMVVRRSVAATAAAAALVAFPVAAAANSLPDSPFYGLKRTIERAQLAVFGGQVQDGFMKLNHAKTRFSEAEQMTALGYPSEKVAATVAEGDRLTREGFEQILAHTSDPATLIRLSGVAKDIEERAHELEPSFGAEAAGALEPVIAASRDVQDRIALVLGVHAEQTLPSAEQSVIAVEPATAALEPQRLSTATTLRGSSSTSSSQSSTGSGTKSGSSSDPKDDPQQPGDGKNLTPDYQGCEIPGSANGLGDLLAVATKVWCS